jgi:acyl transferase domain-containing protein
VVTASPLTSRTVSLEEQLGLLACVSPTSGRARQALSPAGRCRTFDAAADGYGRGEGFVVIALAPASPAPSTPTSPASGAHSEQPLGLLRGSAVNQGGRSSGLTAPSGPAQRRLVAAALAAAGAAPAGVGFVAVHGTGRAPWRADLLLPRMSR